LGESGKKEKKTTEEKEGGEKAFVIDSGNGLGQEGFQKGVPLREKFEGGDRGGQ